MQRIKIKFWRRSSRSIGDKPGSSSSPPSVSSSVEAAAAFSVAEGSVDLSPPMVNCRLCLCDMPQTDMYTMTDCKCSYCSKCCEQYIKVMITEGSVLNISCPDAFCPKGGQFRPTEIEKFTDKKTYARYRRLKFERDVELDPLRTFCPQVGCDTICHMKLHATPQKDSPSKSMSKKAARAISCPTCNHMFCSMCKVKWHGSEVTCDEAMRNGRLEDQGIPFQSSTDAEVKRCPLCHVPIERNDGCAQMMCKRCKHLFCWYCQESLNDDFLLRHYDKGPCKNKLGHTRASVLWHRAQVVGIFTGVGILMLLASPFLLLAAPCILFCKCNPPPGGEDDDDDIMQRTNESMREDAMSSS